jgi:hypothetical protein
MGQGPARSHCTARPSRPRGAARPPGLGTARIRDIRKSISHPRAGGLRAQPVAAPRNIDPDLAISFIRRSFPGMFPEEPAVLLPREGVKFTVSPDGSTLGGFAWAWASGRVDLSAVIDLESRPDGRFVIPVLEILRPITMLAEAVSSPAYSDVYGKARTWLPRRFDWFIAVSIDLVRPGDGATVPWDDLEFPCRRPQRASASRYPSCPPNGYASGRLSNWNPQRPIAEPACRIPGRLPEAERLPHGGPGHRGHHRHGHGRRDHCREGARRARRTIIARCGENRHGRLIPRRCLAPRKRHPASANFSRRDSHDHRQHGGSRACVEERVPEPCHVVSAGLGASPVSHARQVLGILVETAVSASSGRTPSRAATFSASASNSLGIGESEDNGCPVGRHSIGPAA